MATSPLPIAPNIQPANNAMYPPDRQPRGISKGSVAGSFLWSGFFR